MNHLNGHLLCAIDIETTGLDHHKHEIYELAIVPLNTHLDPHPKMIPFDIIIKPENTDDIDWEGMKKTGNTKEVVHACEKGMDKWVAIDALMEWFARLYLPEKKLIVPLAQNWAGIDKIFIQEWLGRLTYEQIFHYHYRDTMTASLYLNDRADNHVEQIPFPKVNLQYLISQLKIETYGRSHTALEDCLNVAKVYKRLLGHF